MNSNYANIKCREFQTLITQSQPVMARDKYFNNHGRKNRFYAKSDLCRHEYIEKYYPIYDQKRIPKLRTIYYDWWYHILRNKDSYTVDCLIQGDYGTFCMIEYGDNKYYIYRNRANYSRVIDSHSSCGHSRGYRGFSGYSHVVSNIEDIINEKRKKYPGCFIYIGYYESRYYHENDPVENQFIKSITLNYLIYFDYDLYKQYSKDNDTYEVYMSYIYQKIYREYFIEIYHSTDSFHGSRHTYRQPCGRGAKILICNIGKVFTNIWNRRRHAIIACMI